MTKQLIPRYSFNATAKTVTFSDFETIKLERVLLITNTTDNVIIYNFADPLKGGTVAGNILTLTYNTATMSDTDKLAIHYETKSTDPQYSRVIVGNARTKFRDGFATDDINIPNLNTWDVTNTADAHIINAGGNSFGSSYMRISLSPFVDSSEVTLTSKQLFSFPSRMGFGLSMSQRFLGQEVFVGLVGVDDPDVSTDVSTVTPIADKSITGATISITSNVGTITLANHGFVGGDRVAIFGCAEHRLNVGPVIVTIIDKNSFTVPITLANGTYSTVGGYVRHTDPFRSAKNGVGYLFENATVTNASFVSRRNGEKYRIANQTVASTTATQSNTSPYTDAFNTTAINELYCSIDEISYRSYPADSVSGISGANKYSQGIPDEEKSYKIHIRARNLSGMTMPVARITTISKTASTTATVTTDAPHGLVAGDYVQVYGVRDATNFPNLTAQTVVGSAPTATTFTVIIGSSSTTSSVGGMVFRNEGSVLSTAIAANIQSIARTNNVLVFTFNTTVTSPLPGEYWHFWGAESAAQAYEGAYKVLRATGSTVEVESTGADFGSITTGGAFIKRTDVRLHFIRELDFTRHYTEIIGGKGNTTDINNAVPVSITGSASLATTGSTTNTPTTGTTQISLNSAASTNATSSKTTAGTLYEISATNMTATTKFLKLYNLATAPTVGTSVPILTLPIPANSEVCREFGALGKRFTTGIAFAITGAQPISDTTAVAAGDVQVHGTYI